MKPKSREDYDFTSTRDSKEKQKRAAPMTNHIRTRDFPGIALLIEKIPFTCA